MQAGEQGGPGLRPAGAVHTAHLASPQETNRAAGRNGGRVRDVGRVTSSMMCLCEHKECWEGFLHAQGYASLCAVWQELKAMQPVQRHYWKVSVPTCQMMSDDVNEVRDPTSGLRLAVFQLTS